MFQGPPPPPPPRILKIAVVGNNSESLIPNTNWPHRLLHVESMTSHVRTGLDTYNGVSGPRYNIISYTWGRYEDHERTTPPLGVCGIDWPIPCIQSHIFTATSFHNAIKHAARGYKQACDWIWVDIACIPQRHDGETTEDKFIRGQEIGRQVEIFQRAKEAFVWLFGLHLYDNAVPRDPQGHGRLVILDDVFALLNRDMEEINNRPTLKRCISDLDYLRELHRTAERLQNWMGRFLEHRWFTSLWTLQEMVLRPDACVLLDDGLFNGPRLNGTPWTFVDIKSDLYFLGKLQGDPSRRRHVRGLRDTALLDFPGHETDIQDYFGSFWSLLQKLENTQNLRGLNCLGVEFPHTAYSAAIRRETKYEEDRIYGIVQVYGISCNPSPPGNKPEAMIKALEDDFGSKLVAKAPLLSQLFIHSSEERPRRSWLITNRCKVDDRYWTFFAHDPGSFITTNLFSSFQVLNNNKEGQEVNEDIVLHFMGRGWNLSDFVTSLPPSSGSSNAVGPYRVPYFKPSLDRADFTWYRGLMLDHHVSRKILGRVVDYFEDEQSTAEAVHKLYAHYIGDVPGRDESLASILVALLGSATHGSGLLRGRLPYVDYVGIVLAPCSTASEGSAASGGASLETEMRLERIGLVRWNEVYEKYPEGHWKIFYNLPPPMDLSCFIV
ncbi:hypothetical protein N0V82_005124 [Gnomoniopsis sp. IMI 355080]|nr:hypothetical protein N0V82_005124 [Gnomoniopsis sp. IMI 355080]